MFPIFVILSQILFCAAQIDHNDDSDILFPDWSIFYSPIDILEEKYLTTINNCLCHESPPVRTSCIGDECKDFPASIVVTLPFFKLQLTGIEVIRRDDLQNLYNLTALEIEGNNKLYKIEKGTFRNMSNLINLTIASNPNLKHLDEKVFEGLVNLEILCMSKNGFLRIYDITSACSALYVPKIKVLSLSEHRFHEIYYNDFYPMSGTKLKELYVTLCEIEVIHPDCLKPLRHLTAIRLCQNLFNRTTITKFINHTVDLGIDLERLNLYEIGFTRITPYALLDGIGRSHIRFLILTANTFNNIDDHWFPPMPNLWNLDMRYCSIIEIEEKAFVPLINLKRLLLGGNKLTTIPYAVTVIKSLTFLDLAANTNDETDFYFIMAPNIFRNMKNMSFLKLSFNYIGYLYNSSLTGLTELTKLNLRNTSLSFIEMGTFAHMKKLEHLDLTNNPFSLKLLSANVFLGLNNLQYLLLGGCSLTNISYEPSLFYHVRNLTHLALDNNNLYFISPNQFENLLKLTDIQLSNNKLSAWNRRRFINSDISVINLSQNKLISLTEGMLEDIEKAQRVQLQGNPFWCDCGLSITVKWIQTNMKRMKYFSEYSLECVGPAKWQQRSVNDFVQYMLDNELKDCETVSCVIWIVVGVGGFLILLVVSFGVWWRWRWHVRYWGFLWKLSFARHHPDQVEWIGGTKQDYKYDAWICYSEEDTPWMMGLLATLDPPLCLCVGERDWQAGTEVIQNALHAVLNSRRTLLVLSDDFVLSQRCRWYAQLAHAHLLTAPAPARNDAVVLVRLNPVKTNNPTLQHLINTRIYLDWPQDGNRQEKQQFWQKLKDILSAS